MFTPKPIAFVLSSTHHGMMIVNRNDYCGNIEAGQGYGVGHQLLNHSHFDASEIEFVLAILRLRKHYFGEGIVGLDCGANIGVHTLEWARLMQGWGEVIAFEAQERIYYSLAGNIALNNCFNARAIWAALDDKCGQITIPEPDYTRPASYGSLELKQNDKNEFIGQAISYDEQKMRIVQSISLDSLNLSRIDLIKLDVEGMEVSVLNGAHETILQNKPVLLIEIIKADEEEVLDFLAEHGYFRVYPMGINILALHHDDPLIAHIEIDDNLLKIG